MFFPSVPIEMLLIKQRRWELLNITLFEVLDYPHISNKQ